MTSSKMIKIQKIISLLHLWFEKLLKILLQKLLIWRHGNLLKKKISSLLSYKIYFCRKVSKEIFEKYGIEYLDNQKSDVTKFTKSSTKKITSFLTSQSSKNKCSSLEK